MLLLVLTFIAATFTTRHEEDRPPPRDITPPDDETASSLNEVSPTRPGRPILLDQPQRGEVEPRRLRVQINADSETRNLPDDRGAESECVRLAFGPRTPSNENRHHAPPLNPAGGPPPRRRCRLLA